MAKKRNKSLSTECTYENEKNLTLKNEEVAIEDADDHLEHGEYVNDGESDDIETDNEKTSGDSDQDENDDDGTSDVAGGDNIEGDHLDTLKEKSNNDGEEKVSKKEKKKKKVFKLSLEDTEDFNAKLQKRGVVYLSRIPPRMGPLKVKQLLSEYGTVTRIYLAEEDKAARKRRMKGGSRGGKRYVEGWVEFEKKSVAKRVGNGLNNTPITNHKRNIHYGDLWNTKYLGRKFQWSHLTEKVAYERRVRDQKLRVEIMQAKRENAAYSTLVEAGKKLDYIEARRSKKNHNKRNHNDATSNTEPPKRKFRQTIPMEESHDKATKSAVLQSL